MKPNPLQQALVGIGVLLVVTATLIMGVFLASSEAPSQAESGPTSTAFIIPTLSPEGGVTEAPGLTERPSATPEVAVTRAATERPGSGSSPTPTRTPTFACIVAPGWLPYQVQRGDTVFSIGLRYGMSVNALLAGNCRSGSQITTGEWLYVPPVTPRAQAAQATMPVLIPATTFPPDDHATQTASDGSCLNPNSAITAPPVGATLSGEAAFYGTARKGDFSYYKLEIRQEGYSTPADFVTFYTGTTEVVNGLLGTLLTQAFRNGEYWIRLTVVDSTGNYLERCSRLYVVKN